MITGTLLILVHFDEIAERAVQLGGVVQGTARSVAARSGQANDFGDLNTADLFTEVSRGIDKWLWFVEAHAQSKR